MALPRMRVRTRTESQRRIVFLQVRCKLISHIGLIRYLADRSNFNADTPIGSGKVCVEKCIRNKQAISQSLEIKLDIALKKDLYGVSGNIYMRHTN